ncbi:MAG TPA: lipid ABC transporter permease/ATP-binding protein, partial [Pasteurellaceae bacterium]|nr:lipid ABC transporter permease/ATP-binding protein [Pasteurellaceae bacterium]
MQEKDLSTLQTFKRLWPTIAPYKAGLFTAAGALILNALTDSALIYLLKPLLDEGFGKAEHDFLKLMAVLVVVFIIFRGLTNFISGYCLAWVSGKV